MCEARNFKEWLSHTIENDTISVYAIDNLLREEVNELVDHYRKCLERAENLQRLMKVEEKLQNPWSDIPETMISGSSAQDTISFGNDAYQHSSYWFDRDRNR